MPAIVDGKGNPLTPEITVEQEALAQGKAREFQNTLVGQRKVMSADELASLVAPQVQCENVFKFPDKSAFFFTINGVIGGVKHRGMLFAGECILVFAKNEKDAKDMAVRGLRQTIELLHEEYNTRKERETRDLIQQGIEAPDVGGRRSFGDPSKGLRGEGRSMMERIVADVFSGKK